MFKKLRWVLKVHSWYGHFKFYRGQAREKITAVVNSLNPIKKTKRGPASSATRRKRDGRWKEKRDGRSQDNQ